MSGRHVTGWAIEEDQRRALLSEFPPAYPDVVADHITLWSKQPPDAEPPLETHGQIIGRADDGQGVEAMVVRIAGTHQRPDGSVYHITWSLDRSRGRKAVESNEVIAKKGWTPLPTVEIPLRPSRWPD